MSILSRMKGMWSGLVSLLKDAESVEPNPKPTIVLGKGTRPDVRAAFEADPNYEVVDGKPMPRIPTMSTLDGWMRGAYVLPGRLRGNGYVHNETFDVGINRAKRAIKAIKNKRERRAARTRFIRQLRVSGIKD